jgi:phosphatidylglycerol:prolipoprotein diacylglycerol transferase
MYPELLHIGPLTIYTYGLMMATAFLVCYLILKREITKRGDNPEIASNIVFWAAIGGILGSKVLYMIEYFQDVIEDPVGMIFSGAGLVFHGGLIGGTLAVVLVIRKAKKSVGDYADFIGPVLLIGQGIGRIGCFFAGCCHGMKCNLPWGIVFPYASPPANYPVHPTQLYETIINFSLFFLLVKVIHPKMTRVGMTFAIYLMLAGTERFLLEFIRVNPKVALGLSSAQYTSIALIVVGLIIALFFTKARNVKLNNKNKKNK